VVKLDGPAHKQAAGGVALGISSASEARDAAERMGGRVLVARQVPAGVEAFCGLTRDPDYGPVLAVGLGGRAIEALGLAAVALTPLDEQDAHALVAEAPGLAQLASPDAAAALAATLVALSRLAADRPEIEEVDINPLILGDDGAIAVDALVVVKGAP
jgi:acetyltransferase